MPALFLAKHTALSDPHRNSAPSRNPDTATSQAGVFPAASARWMAGCNNDQKLAAIITPEENPNIRFSALHWGFEKDHRGRAKCRHQTRSPVSPPAPTRHNVPHRTSRNHYSVREAIRCIRLSKKPFGNYLSSLEISAVPFSRSHFRWFSKSGKTRPTSAQKRAEWFISFRWHSSWTTT